MPHSSSRRVIVVGGGIFGMSTALQLVRRGAQVTLVTEGALASGASGRSLSWLNSSRYRSAEYHLLRMAGLERYRTLAWQHPESRSWLRFDGGLTWDADEPANEIGAVFAHETEIGYEAEWLGAAEIERVTPGVDVGSVTPQGAIFNPGEGWVDLPSLIRHLLQPFLQAGGALREQVGKVRLEDEGKAAPVVRLGDGSRLEADAVLLATGPWVPASLADLGLHLPDQTPTAFLLKTRPLAHPLRAVLNTPRVAIRPTPDGAFVLDSAWSEEELQGGAPDAPKTPSRETIAKLLAEASAVLSGHPVLEMESSGVGPKPIPADGDPVFGPIREVPGLSVAFSHSGATLGLVAGEFLAHEIATGETHPMLEPFRAARFGDLAAASLGAARTGSNG